MAYFICTTPHAGDELLCEALSSTCVAGHPAEYFSSEEQTAHNWLQDPGIGRNASYAGTIMRQTATPNGMFGAKLHWSQANALHNTLLTDHAQTETDGGGLNFERLLQWKFGSLSYVWLSRRNKVAQGISYHRASDMAVRRSKAGQGRQSSIVDHELDFNFANIDRAVKLMEGYDRCWKDYFRKNRLRPLLITSEQLAENFERVVCGILKFLGLPEDVPIVKPDVDWVPDPLLLEWERRYREMAETAIASTRHPARAMTKMSVRRTKSTGESAKNQPKNQEPSLALTAYTTTPGIAMPIVPGLVSRSWMEATPARFAYRCLPLLIANQAGWLIINEQKVAVSWNGTTATDALEIKQLSGKSPCRAMSHFGHGILTWTIPYLFRTPPGYNLHVRGPSNWPKDGICALEGIVETDWAEATFTMNWKLTRPHHTIVFEEGEPVAMIVPVQRGVLERFHPLLASIADNPELQSRHEAWSHARRNFNKELKQPGSDAQKAGWQRHYMQGVTIDEFPAQEHQRKLLLREFVFAEGAKNADRRFSEE